MASSLYPKEGPSPSRLSWTGPQVQIEVTNPMSESPYEHKQGNRMAIDNIRNRMTALYGPEALLTTNVSEGFFTVRLIYPVKG